MLFARARGARISTRRPVRSDRYLREWRTIGKLHRHRGIRSWHITLVEIDLLQQRPRRRPLDFERRHQCPGNSGMLHNRNSSSPTSVRRNAAGSGSSRGTASSSSVYRRDHLRHRISSQRFSGEAPPRRDRAGPRSCRCACETAFTGERSRSPRSDSRRHPHLHCPRRRHPLLASCIWCTVTIWSRSRAASSNCSAPAAASIRCVRECSSSLGLPSRKSCTSWILAVGLRRRSSPPSRSKTARLM